MALATSSVKIAAEPGKTSYLFPLILVTSLFFLWGLAYGLLDVLNKHFQELLNVTKTRSTLLQGAYFGAYFLIALPAGLFMNKYGYKKGIITGLLLYTAGALLFFPSAQYESYNFFLLSLFILAAGLTFLETAANPYITVLGKPETSEFRLNLSQSFNGVGAFIGPIIGANLFFATGGEGNLDSVKYVYLVIAVIVFLVALLFMRTPLPEIKEEKLVTDAIQDVKPLFSHKNFTGAIIAQFFCVAAQVGIAALFINYCTEASTSITNANASYYLSISLVLFTIGRFVGTALMRTIAPNKLLTVYALINIVLCVVVFGGKGMVSVYSLMAIFFFESIMFPTIFALGVKNLGHNTKKGASFIIMSIAGGAFMPYIMGLLSEKATSNAYIIPLFCFVIVAWYGWRGYRSNHA